MCREKCHVKLVQPWLQNRTRSSLTAGIKVIDINSLMCQTHRGDISLHYCFGMNTEAPDSKASFVRDQQTKQTQGFQVAFGNMLFT